MKKHLLILISILFAGGLAAYGILNDEYSYAPQAHTSCNAQFVTPVFTTKILAPIELTDFFYDIGPRFNPITKQSLVEASSVSDFIDQNEISRMDGVRSTALIMLENDIQTDNKTSGESESLTAEQMEMIKSFEYSTSFLLRVVFRTEDSQAELKGENIYYPHMTVIPEKQAAYSGGKDAVLEYLRANNEKNTYNLDEKKLQPAKLYFTVTKEGKVSGVRLDKTCGYSDIDKAMLELMTNLPGEWFPAENEKAEKVDQELVISFGIVGC
jgi:hypothetical protein